jgi:hypothetical protein
MCWVIRKKNGDLFYQVGYYTPDGIWIAIIDDTPLSEAMEKVHYLNGGNNNG